MPGTKVCHLLAQKSYLERYLLTNQVTQQVRTPVRGSCCKQAQPPHMLEHLGPSVFFPREMWSPPSPSISCAACAGNQQMLTGAALGSQHALVGLQFQAVVAQECCCGCSPLPGLPVRQGQWQPLPAGLAPKLLLGCRASNVPVHRGSCARQTCSQMASAAQPHHSAGGSLQLWGRAAPGLRNPASSCSHLSRCQLRD